MICRMTREQRIALVHLIQAVVEENASSDMERSQDRLEAEEHFHKLFANEYEDGYESLALRSQEHDESGDNGVQG